MRAQRTKRLFAASAAGVLLAGGAAIGAAGTAAAAPAHASSYSHNFNRDCDDRWDDGCGYGGYGHNGGYDHNGGNGGGH
ncbi:MULTISPECIES: hypothetical protein [Streptomyces]|uniref:hypothetical protein n=1 Tax=Streptomyces TaxID=1883 RepID=UPI00073DC366|nr:MULTISPECIES: hypothetical protein [unclassified Streptomyces]OYP13215.1 hypothetical protein CFC35_00765 [Streptomyces sp. FBKL.4005]BCM64875.1 hypothetical protein EASAB2608_00209 [Streptomyces sp. EAS-AB2608]CUW32789.1 hypothetical protein TUE45_pSRTUE45c_0157 [Streptomyces reticuli]